jgi:hypothetical protein
MVLGCSSSGGEGNDAGGGSGGGAGHASAGSGGGTAGGAAGAAGSTAGAAGGAAGATGGSGGATAGAGGSQVSCMNYSTNDGCLCSSGGHGTLAACSPDSVKMTDSGFCCGDQFLCSCFRIACVSLPNIKSCDCGVPLDSSGTRVDSCPTPTGGVCCLEATPGQPSRCHCSGYDTTCMGTETMVPSCSLDDVKDCGTDAPNVDLCK